MSDSETPDLDELEAKHERNRQQRLEFVKFWAEYVRTHPDEEWARQQAVVIDGQVDPPAEAEEGDGGSSRPRE